MPTLKDPRATQLVLFVMDFSITAIRSAFITDEVLGPVSGKVWSWLLKATSPGWAIVGLEVWLGQPLLEPELPQSHPLSDFTPFRDCRQDYLKLLGRKLTEQLGELLGGDLNHQLNFRHEGFLLNAESTRGRILAAPLVPDLVQLTECAQRKGEAGPMTHLACFFKDPLDVRVQSFTEQFQTLKDYVAKRARTR